MLNPMTFVVMFKTNSFRQFYIRCRRGFLELQSTDKRPIQRKELPLNSVDSSGTACSAMTVRTAPRNGSQRFRFLDLPPELREMVYRELTPNELNLSRKPYIGKLSVQAGTKSTAPCFKLLAINRQLREEVLVVLKKVKPVFNLKCVHVPKFLNAMLNVLSERQAFQSLKRRDVDFEEIGSPHVYEALDACVGARAGDHIKDLTMVLMPWSAFDITRSTGPPRWLKPYQGGQLLSFESLTVEWRDDAGSLWTIPADFMKRFQEAERILKAMFQKGRA